MNKSFRLSLLVSCMTPAAPLGALQAQAATSPAALTLYPIQLSAQPLSDALRDLSRQTGLEIVFSPELVRGRQAASVSGRLSADTALHRLLVSQRDNNAIPYTLNGARAWVRFSRARLDAFDLKPTAYGHEALGDDHINHAVRFSGVTMGLALPKDILGGSQLYVDPFLWPLRQREITWLDSTAREERYYAGAHVWGNAGPAKIDWTVNHQFGDYGNRDISAWQVLLNQTIDTGLGKVLPNAGFVFNYASGGGGRTSDPANPGNLHNALSPHGANTPFAHHLFLAATNILAVAPKVEIRPVQNVRILAEYEFVWRDSVHDAIYRPSGRALASTADVTARKTGELPRVQLQWAITPRISFTTRYEHVFAGSALTQAGYGDSDFLASWISLRF